MKCAKIMLEGSIADELRRAWAKNWTIKIETEWSMYRVSLLGLFAKIKVWYLFLAA